MKDVFRISKSIFRAGSHMFVEHLKVRNFRNIESTSIDLINGNNLFIGENGQGKTNLLESVLFLATSTSHRTIKEREMIRHGENVAYILGEVAADTGTKKMETGLSQEKKTVKLQGRPLSRIGDLYGHLRVVLFSPEDLHIIKGSPRLRRKYLDLSIAQMRGDHVSLLQSYRKMLKQRQIILREAEDLKTVSAQLDVWEQQLAAPAAEIIRRRQVLVEKLSVLTRELTLDLSGGADELELAYRSTCGSSDTDLEESCRKKFRASREKDQQQRQTAVGPHRDDLEFLLHRGG